MGNPILNRTVSVPAGLTGVRLDIRGKFVKIVSCTAASVLLGFEQETPERVYADDVLEGGDYGFESLHFVADVAACTVVLQVSEFRLTSSGAINGAAMLVQMTAAAASLVNIDADLERLKPGTVPTLIPLQVVPIAPAPAVQLVAAGNVKESVFQAPLANAGTIYLGYANTVDATNAFAELVPGGSVSVRHDVNIWAVCDAGVNNIRGGRYA
jgi:hypothetical protein